MKNLEEQKLELATGGCGRKNRCGGGWGGCGGGWGGWGTFVSVIVGGGCYRPPVYPICPPIYPPVYAQGGSWGYGSTTYGGGLYSGGFGGAPVATPYAGGYGAGGAYGGGYGGGYGGYPIA
jgi:hypothetical protein